MPENIAHRVYRFDYLKFKFDTDPEHFSKLLDEIKAAYSLTHQEPPFDRFHKVNLFHSHGNFTYTYFVDIWGEACALAHFLPREPYFNCLKRCDVRAIEFDLTEEEIKLVGNQLTDHAGKYNIVTYYKKKGTKRLGRDRGGRGFAIGSHKSDLRIVYYKRTSEPSAVEFQYQGQKLINCIRGVLAADEELQFGSSSWLALKNLLSEEGEKRVRHVLKAADIASFIVLPREERHMGDQQVLL